MGSIAVLCRLYGADMAAAGRGQMLLTSSLTALAPLPGAGLYGATRAFVHSLAGAMSAELEPRGVTVRCLLPGATLTDFSSTAKIETALAFTGPFFEPLGMVCTANTVAAVGFASLTGPATDSAGTSFIQRTYATAAAWLLPRSLAASFSALVFGPDSPLASPSALRRSLPTLLPAAFLLICAVPLTVLLDLVLLLRARGVAAMTQSVAVAALACVAAYYASDQSEWMRKYIPGSDASSMG